VSGSGSTASVLFFDALLNNRRTLWVFRHVRSASCIWVKLHRRDSPVSTAQTLIRSARPLVVSNLDSPPLLQLSARTQSMHLPFAIMPRRAEASKQLIVCIPPRTF
jgi:hypothetical protein